MWQYEKKLQYPVNIKNPNPALAKVIVSQFGGLNCKRIYNSFLRVTLLNKNQITPQKQTSPHKST